MKRTHFSVGIADRYYTWARRQRTKHNTACGTVCDLTKATTERRQVTCRMCLRKLKAL